MRRNDSTPGSSGWAWGTSGPPAPPPPPHRARGGGGGAAGTWLAAGLFVAIVGGVVAYVVTTTRDGDSDASAAAVADAPTQGSPAVDEKGAPVPVVDAPDVAAPPPVDAGAPDGPRSLDPITWTVATPMSIDELVQAWSLPRETLLVLNPTLPTDEPIPAGTKVIVHKGAITGSESVGPPNDGRLLGAVPMLEGRSWQLAPDRTRAFGTGETITAVLAALDADAAKFPGAIPIQLGEISARRGGPIYGHQSHQAGRDIDIRLVATTAGDRFDAERNWFLVKTLIESGEVVAVFLNRSQQVWLRAAAEADVGSVAGADRYFALISHEPGHTIHMHVRFRCPDNDYRCVAYSLGETDEEVAKVLGKLPSGGGGGALVRNKGKIPTLRPKSPPKTPTPAKPTPKTPSKPSGKLPSGKLPGGKG